MTYVEAFREVGKQVLPKSKKEFFNCVNESTIPCLFSFSICLILISIFSSIFSYMTEGFLPGPIELLYFCFGFISSIFLVFRCKNNQAEFTRYLKRWEVLNETDCIKEIHELRKRNYFCKITWYTFSVKLYESALKR